MLNSPTQQVRCAIYTRKSSDEGLEQEFNSLDAQRESCEAYIRSQQHEGWIALPTLYDDGGFSGGSLNRPAVQQLLKDIKEGLVDTVVVYKVDRLTRSLMDFAKIVEIFDGHGASFVSVTQQFNTTTSMGRLTLNVLLSFAQFEREVTGERIRDKVAASKAKGMWTGGAIPLGYDTVDKKLVVNSAEADTVRMIYERYLQLGCVRLLQQELEINKIYGKRRIKKTGEVKENQPLSRSSLYQILHNHIYVGEISHNGNVYPAQHVGIVDRELWKKTQESLKESASIKKYEVNAKSSASLAGLVYDDRGNRLTSTHSRKGEIRYRYYTSQAVLQNRADKAGSIMRVPAHQIEAAVLDQIKTVLGEKAELLDAITHSSDDTSYKKIVLQNAEELSNSLQTLQPSEIKQALYAILIRVVVFADKLQINFSRSGLRAWLEGHPPSIAIIEARNKTADLKDQLQRHIPLRVQKSARQTKLIIQQSSAPHQINDALVKAVLRAHSWRNVLLSGEVRSIQEIADHEKLPHRYTARILRLAFLAPNLTEAILDGRQPPELTVEKLMDEMPINWSEQRQAFMTEAA